MHRGVYKNILANSLGLLATALVGFFLTPFILHRLGNVGFGLWVLASTFTGYYGLLDFGIRSALTRYVARFAATEDWDNVGRVVSTALFTYSVICLVILLLSGGIAWYFASLFRVSPEWVRTGKLVVLIFGAGTALGVPMGVFAGVLEGLQRFTWIGGVQVMSALLRAVLVVIALGWGRGLLALACISVGTTLLGYLIYMLVVFRLCPQLRLRRTDVQKSTVHLLAGFGLVASWIAIAQQLRFQTDALVIGTFLTVQAISFFSIGAKLVSYATEAVQTMAQVFTPMSSHFDASGDLEQLRRILIVGNRYSSLLIFPMSAVLLVLGKSIIRVWVGPAYLSSYAVLAILTVPTALYLAQAASTKVLYGMAHHSVLAQVLFLEGVSNLVLSIILLKWYGINGVALGTAIPLACTSLFFLPSHLCRLVGLRLGSYLWEAHFYPLLLCVPLVLVLWSVDRLIQPQTYGSLLLKLTAGAIVYGVLALGYFYWTERPGNLRWARWP